MHRCLEISEVLNAILGRANRRTLASLARTCHDLRDPALDVLWHSQTSLVPILKCLPAHIWQEIVLDKRRILRIRHPITPDDWHGVQIYNHRVKELAVETAELDADFFRALEFCTPDSFLFPNLRVLSWTLEDDGFFHFCRPLLAPSLVNVTLVLQDCAPDLSMLSLLRISHPHLTDVHLGVPDSPTSVRVVSSTLCTWQVLQKLTVATLDETGLVHIAALPQLTDLQLHGYIPPLSAESLDVLMPAQPFPVLRHLDIVSDTIQSAFALIAHVSSPRLRALHVNTEQCAPAATWEASFRILARLPCRPNLLSLSLSQPSNPPVPIPATAVHNFILSPRALRPLLRLRRLATVRLHPPLGVDLDDEALHEMATAWPRVERLTVRRAPGRPHTTLHALLFLAAHCPDLRVLELALDATGPVPRVARPDRTHPAHALAHLHTGGSPVGEPARVAAFLSGIFAGPAFGPRRAEGDPWGEVARLFPVFRAVRNAEARFWNGEESDSDGDEDEESESGSEGDSEDDDHDESSDEG
ncbi:hypothetical protein FB451DRAFT_1441531 [Mycena latifolia]|nr:hypothetical protein FB451DRAFT_1441531 [Mycena latifolia]